MLGSPCRPCHSPFRCSLSSELWRYIQQGTCSKVTQAKIIVGDSHRIHTDRYVKHGLSEERCRSSNLIQFVNHPAERVSKSCTCLLNCHFHAGEFFIDDTGLRLYRFDYTPRRKLARLGELPQARDVCIQSCRQRLRKPGHLLHNRPEFLASKLAGSERLPELDKSSLRRLGAGAAYDEGLIQGCQDSLQVSLVQPERLIRLRQPLEQLRRGRHRRTSLLGYLEQLLLHRDGLCGRGGEQLDSVSDVRPLVSGSNERLRHLHEPDNSHPDPESGKGLSCGARRLGEAVKVLCALLGASGEIVPLPLRSDDQFFGDCHRFISCAA